LAASWRSRKFKRNNQERNGPDWIHEIKHDGYRLIVVREGKRVRLFTRNGYDWADRYPLIVEAALRNRSTSFVVDGEAVLLGVDGIEVLPHHHPLRGVGWGGADWTGYFQVRQKVLVSRLWSLPSTATREPAARHALSIPFILRNNSSISTPNAVTMRPNTPIDGLRLPPSTPSYWLEPVTHQFANDWSVARSTMLADCFVEENGSHGMPQIAGGEMR
jgi:hypothetical protein